ncbi:LysR family transcriptional regulator [Shewanella oneidensis MR-1]|uniref:Transcriptional regulator LysR family n=1 Tax=Shewanella oneidensis (strain ATCC 700550 / JCM 31522 / CIP 106686 / LMG 19005 / NCIMB 14063 / MR-1) TaxID=211586 RepID=Q8EJT8_SHEON|nr:LysR family transcriptional regulator [Shewanella oneidensis]AAN53454.1 transcriptional regulator LysR family [Shewanella oneidensis MR-1]MDX5997679.1 LysR substrate-binding domain-containing protein [Shewanella oneidensis]MEE2029712.1 HTH-type transcriptional regulator DmlR [Shewanella oneidensis]QKG95302.1 LysR family transcriptional regulator [Shewanella oneidensis MR-1]
MEHFSALPIFVTVVECGSFSLAGQKLGLSKSAISKRISQLEQHLGIQLLQRTTRSLSLTDAGARYFEYIRPAVQLTQEGLDAISELQQTPRGNLRISVPMVFGRLYIAPLIAEFLKRYPDIQLQMQMDDKITDLIAGGFDLAIRIGELPDSSLIARKIAPCLSVICASPAYLTQHGLPMTPCELTQHNCLFYSYFQDGVEWSFHSPDGMQRVQPKGNYQVNNSDAINQACLDGLGIANLPRFIVEPDLQTGHLQALLTDYPLPEHGIYAVYPQRKYQPTKVTVLIEFLMAKLGQY